MRIRRVRAAASPEVRAALASGQITLYRADEISKLPPGQQQIALVQWADRSLCRTEGQRLAASVIREALRRRAKVDLDQIAAAIRTAIGAPGNTRCPD
jgi:hypothetical protein